MNPSVRDLAMLLPIPDEVLQAQARDRVVDALLGSLGVSAAVVSASFAGYMLVSGPAAEQPSRPAGAPAAVAGLLTQVPRTLAPVPPAEADAPAPAPGDIDFDPTGSIPLGAAKPQAATDARAPLPDFAVRDAFDGTALVEAHGALRMVQTGTTIEGAGRVLSIARQGKGWVVATTGGLILQRR